MHGIALASAVRNHRNVVRGRHVSDLHQFAHASAPVNVRLPDFGSVDPQQLPETVARVNVLAGDDARGLDLLAQAAESLVVVRRQRLLDPVDVVGFKGFRQFDRVAFGERHPAVHQDVAVIANGLAGPFDQSDILPDALPAVRRAEGQRQLQALVAELDVLLDVVARAIAWNPRMDATAEEAPNRRVPLLPREVPERDIHAGDRVDHGALAPVRHRGAPLDVPQAFDVERVLAQQQPPQVVLDDDASRRPAPTVTLEPLVGFDFDPETAGSRPRRPEEAPHRLVLRIDRDRIGDLDATRGPRAWSRFVSRHRALQAHVDQADARDAQAIIRFQQPAEYRRRRAGASQAQQSPSIHQCVLLRPLRRNQRITVRPDPDATTQRSLLRPRACCIEGASALPAALRLPPPFRRALPRGLQGPRRNLLPSRPCW